MPPRRQKLLELVDPFRLLYEREQLLLGVDAQFAVEVLAVGVHGVSADEQLLFYEADVPAAGKVGEHLGLAGGQAVLGGQGLAALVEPRAVQAREPRRELQQVALRQDEAEAVSPRPRSWPIPVPSLR